MKLKSLDHKEISIVENEHVACIEAIYMDGRKANVCRHVVDGVLPRAIKVQAQTGFHLHVEGEDPNHDIDYTLWPSVFVCADCLVEYLADGASSGAGADLPARRPAPVRTGV